MVWWLFSRKKEDSLHPHIRKIESTLKNSFENIKNDVFKITSHITKHGDHIEDIKERLTKLEHNLSFLHGKLDNYKEEEIDEEEYYDVNEGLISDGKEKIIDNLTNVQMSIITRLADLQSEAEESWISAKNLTEDLYPEKEYSKVRPMMSDYLNILLDFGLIYKIRKRRQTYISLSPKGLNFIPKSKQKKLIKLVNKKN